LWRKLKPLLLACGLSLALCLPLQAQQRSSSESSLPITLSCEDYEAIVKAMEEASAALTRSNDKIAEQKRLLTKLYVVSGTLLAADLLAIIVIAVQEFRAK
jgi:hypothetical protein